MKIQMIGIDHTRAPLDVRQRFAFTKKAMGEALGWMKEQEGILGAVILSTCNRMELWLSCREEESLDAYHILCGARRIEGEPYREYFKLREREAAVRHLFRMAGGLKSRIVGEDQILTQVKEAASFSREQGCMDQLLEVLFRMAVTTGKKIKTQAPIHRADYSAAHQALEALRLQGYSLNGKNCLVIGNGEMGRLTALALLEEGAKVTMTLRRYHKGEFRVPEGCGQVSYTERYQQILDCDLVVSATASPNFTITREGMEELFSAREQRETGERQEAGAFPGKQERIFIDLAVPRDIEPAVGKLPGICLYDIDSFHIAPQSKEMQAQMQAAEAIVEEMEGEFFGWVSCRELIPKVQEISGRAARDVVWRTGKAVKGLKLTGEDREGLERSMEEAAAKVVGKLMFGLRDSLSAEAFRECLEVLGQVYSNG